MSLEAKHQRAHVFSALLTTCDVLINGKFATQRLQQYPSGLCKSLAQFIIWSFQRMSRDGTGPGGHIRVATNVCRISAWGEHSSCHEAVAILNEDVARSQRVVIDDLQSAIYLHVDDGVVCTAGQYGDAKANEIMNVCADGVESFGFTVNDKGPRTKL